MVRLLHERPRHHVCTPRCHAPVDESFLSSKHNSVLNAMEEPSVGVCVCACLCDCAEVACVRYACLLSDDAQLLADEKPSSSVKDRCF